MMVLPFLSLYLTKDLNWTLSDAALAAGCFGIGSLFGALLGGQLLSRYSSSFLMYISLILSGLGYLFLLVLNSKYLFCFGIGITSLLASLFSPCVFAAIEESSTDETRTRAITLTRLAMNLGIALGPLAAALLIKNLGYASLFVADGLTCILAGILLAIYSKRSALVEAKNKVSEMAVGSPMEDSVFLFFMLFCMFNGIAFIQIINSIPVFFSEVHGLSETQIAFFFTINGLVIFLIEMPVIKYFESYKNPLVLIAIGSAMMAAAHFSLVIFYGSFLAVAIYTFMITLGEIINFPYVSSLSLERAKGKNVGAYMGLMTFMFALNHFIGAPIGLYIADHWGYTSLWIFMGLLGVVATIGFCLLFKSFDASKTNFN